MNIIHLLYMENPQKIDINKLYENLTYFDTYSGSFVLFIIITLVVIQIIIYALIMINVEPIRADWANQRCNPYIVPIAGLINKPDNMSINDFTQENFAFCTQNVLSGISGNALKPITFVAASLQKVADGIKNSLNGIRGMFDNVRTSAMDVAQELMGRLMNLMAPIQQIIIAFKDMMGKVNGIMTAALYTLLGSYYTLQSLMGAIAEFIIRILIVLAALIAGFWLFPFTWGAAMANTVIFIAISIPMIIILAFMSNSLQIKGGSIPKLKCFDNDTLLAMKDGTMKKIMDVCVGDVLKGDNKITAKMVVTSSESTMYNLNGVIVSDTHLVFSNGRWLRVSECADAIKVDMYDKPFLYCLNTSEKIIEINNTLFSDWDEIMEDDIELLNLYHIYNKYGTNHSMIRHFEKNMCHEFFDGGFDGDTLIKLDDGKNIKISEVKVGDILDRREKVYGIVEIDGTTVKEQYNYYLEKNNGETSQFVGGPYLAFCDRNVLLRNTFQLNDKFKDIRSLKREKLYHLLTDKESFIIDNIRFYDYSASNDLLLGKNKGKLLSMKYV